MKPGVASVSSTYSWCISVVHYSGEDLVLYSNATAVTTAGEQNPPCHITDTACCVVQLFVKAGAGSNGLGRPSGGVILDKVLLCALCRVMPQHQ